MPRPQHRTQIRRVLHDLDRRHFGRRLARLLRGLGIRPPSKYRRRGSGLVVDRRDDVSVRMRRVQAYVEGYLEEVRARDGSPGSPG